MMISERHDKILALLNKRGRISIQELQQLMLVSVSTLRRDLDQLAESGEVQRIHGGVELTKQQQTLQHEALLSQKNEMNLSAKQVIARTAMRELHGGETIYLDAGSTTGAMIALLGNLQPAPQVVTNSVHHASQLADLMVPVIIIGGQVKLSTNATIGVTAAEQLGQLALDVSFLGADAVNTDMGIMTPDLEEATIKKLVINRSNKVFVLADNSKFDRVAFAKVSDLADITLITDKSLASAPAYQAKTDIIVGGES